jgi:hypothetical protein
MMTSFTIEIRKTHNLNILNTNEDEKNNINKSNKILNTKNCWFCERPCNTFVSICHLCKKDKFKKLRH